jgi:DNA-binding response OmpR family regulator
MRRLVVLVVEDDPDCAAVLAEALAMDGHEVMVALDAADARLQAERRCPDLAIVDGHLGGDAGLELVRSLRQGPAGDLPVLLATGMSEAEVGREAREAGVDAILVKPIELPVLLAAVARLGGGRGARELA